MSKLTEALEFISIWLQQHNSKLAASLQPGLKYEEIEEIVRYLPVKLPAEVYELYQWRNGGGFIPLIGISHNPEVTFFSLEEAIEIYESWNTNLFPLFFIEDVGVFIVVDKEEKEISPVYANDELSLPKEADFDSLTSMMTIQVEELKSLN